MNRLPPRRPRTGLRAPAGARALGLGVALAVVATGCFGPTREPPVPIPPGIPPGAGAPVPTVDIDAPGRTSDQLRPWAEGIAEPMRIPVPALAAYGNAAETMRQTRPECNLAWTTLAGIGRVESRHGNFRGSRLEDDGVARPTIIGPRLDGSPGYAEIRDTDKGELDGDTEYDRAIGPLQFIPETWRKYGRDANGDGHADPNQIDDAAVSAARPLCDRGGDLSQAENWQRAVLAYNASREYVMDVRDAAAAYSVGTTAP